MQGGAGTVIERNFINGSGGSGISMYQGPGQRMIDTVIRANVIANIRDAEGRKNQRGIEYDNANSLAATPAAGIGNNSVNYNLLVNITNIALRSKALPVSARPLLLPSSTAFTQCPFSSWHWYNNIVLNAGTGFFIRYVTDASTSAPLPHSDCVFNNIFACTHCKSGYRHQDGWSPRVRPSLDTLSHNLYYPDNSSYFCVGSGSATECTAFEGWVEAAGDHGALGNGSISADPLFTAPDEWAQQQLQARLQHVSSPGAGGARA